MSPPPEPRATRDDPAPAVDIASLLDLQRRFARSLADGVVRSPVPTATPTSGRLAVYRNTVRANYRNALRATYPVVRALVDTPFFHAAVDAFVAAHPSSSGDLNEYGDAFGDFLRSYPHAAALPYLADVACLEWAIDEAHRASDLPPMPDTFFAALAVVPQAEFPRLRFELDPSCRLVHADYPAMRVWRAHQGDLDEVAGIDFAPATEDVLVRRESGAVALERIDAAQFAWLRALQRGEDLGMALGIALAIDAAFDFEGSLQRRLADRTLAALRMR